MPQPLATILLGAGGHASVLVALLEALGCKPLGVCDPRLAQSGTPVWRDLCVLGDDDALARLDPQQVRLVNGIGPQPDTGPALSLRQKIQIKWADAGFHFASLVHPSAWVAPDVILDAGVQIMAGAVVQSGCHLGTGVVINSGATVDHDCNLDRFVHIAPGATLCGNVHVAERSYIGTGAVVVNNTRIGSGALLAAGATLVSDLPDNRPAYGTPAKIKLVASKYGHNDE